MCSFGHRAHIKPAIGLPRNQAQPQDREMHSSAISEKLSEVLFGSRGSLRSGGHVRSEEGVGCDVHWLVDHAEGERLGFIEDLQFVEAPVEGDVLEE